MSELLTRLVVSNSHIEHKGKDNEKTYDVALEVYNQTDECVRGIEILIGSTLIKHIAFLKQHESVLIDVCTLRLCGEEWGIYQYSQAIGLAAINNWIVPVKVCYGTDVIYNEHSIRNATLSVTTGFYTRGYWDTIDILFE